MTIEIPALDRLCAWLEGHDKAGLVGEIENEIVRKLEEAVKSGVPKPAFKEVPADDDHPWKDEAKAEEPTAAAGRGTTSSVTADVAPPSPEGKGKGGPAAPVKTVTLADVQRVAALMRDEGKLSQVTGMFKEFGINKLSDLQGNELQKFAAKLREMGAKI